MYACIYVQEGDLETQWSVLWSAAEEVVSSMLIAPALQLSSEAWQLERLTAVVAVLGRLFTFRDGA